MRVCRQSSLRCQRTMIGRTAVTADVRARSFRQRPQVFIWGEGICPLQRSELCMTAQTITRYPVLKCKTSSLALCRWKTHQAREKRRYVPRAEGSVLLIDATIALLRELPFRDVTVRRIAERADLNVVAIKNIFGSQQGLFVAVTRELGNRFAAMMAALPDDQIQFGLLFDENVVLRTRLLAWLIGQGADPELFKVEPEFQVSAIFMARQKKSGADEHQIWLFGQILQYLGEGFIVFQDTHDRRPGDFAQAAAALSRVRQELPKLMAEMFSPPEST